jgi:SAM-dependent methyltransferase
VTVADSLVRFVPGLVRMRRRQLARRHLSGGGIEIGALHNPLELPPGATVRYVDRMPVAELREHYPELAGEQLVDVDVIDDGETLSTVGDESVDFVVANHFLEHCEDPIKALLNMFRVLRPGGVLYLAVPDKRFTFDRNRELTSLQHLVDDYENGADRSRRGHYEDWARHVDEVDEDRVAAHADELLARGYSIHFHVWTADEVQQLLARVRDDFGAGHDVAQFVRNGHENVFVLRKRVQASAAGEDG